MNSDPPPVWLFRGGSALFRVSPSSSALAHNASAVQFKLNGFSRHAQELFFKRLLFGGGSEIIHVPPVFPHLVRGTTAKQNERPEFTRMVIRKGLRGDLSQFGFSGVGRLCSEI